eukprot:GEMP01041658.1.p1 GENE.GEMP01041658.1~~GEMP01041658.1.p1  ORF type:complete len:398 (+),score=109.40 GEMP01041658.1:215-1408(+)
MGVSCALSLHKRGAAVTLVDKTRGLTSSWGESRITRVAYTDPLYIQMMRFAYTKWRELEKCTHTKLLHWSGILDIASEADYDSLDDLRRAYDECEVQYEQLNAEDITTRWSMIRPSPDVRGIFTEEAALIMATDARTALFDLLEQADGATVKDAEVVEVRDGNVAITDEGEEIAFDKVVLCTGMWTNAMLRRLPPSLVGDDVQLPIVPTLEQFSYYESAYSDLSVGHMPIILARGRVSQSPIGCYLKPHVKDGIPGIQCGSHRNGVPIDIPAGVHSLAGLTQWRKYQAPVTDDCDPILQVATDQFVQTIMPEIDLVGEKARASYGRCIYQCHLYDDDHFIVGLINPSVAVCTGFGGEGFKFAPAIGELVSDLILAERTHPWTAAAVQRFKLFRPLAA